MGCYLCCISCIPGEKYRMGASNDTVRVMSLSLGQN